ncbi:MAG: ribosome small subunit-dependent GTPase A [bacterium]|nr:ribosome small subunit-dependent GTPase A [bacterium]
MELRSLGWNDRLNTHFKTLNSESLEAGRVIRVDRGAVLVARSTAVAHAALAQQLDPNGEEGPAAVGDWVAVDTTADDHFVRSILPRVGLLSRRRPGAAEESQPVAANVDIVLLAEGLDRGANIRRIERGVALAYDCGATPVVVLTKSDLCTDLDSAVAQAETAAPFTWVTAISSLSGEGTEAIKDLLRHNRTGVLLGPSGAGKSTLVNSLLNEERLTTSHVRAGDSKGRHTTTRRELVILPGGGCLIDTPGVRELGLWLEPSALEHAYSDIAELAKKCRFVDCSHTNEPGCAVRKAVDEGELSVDRIEGYLKLQREAESLELRRDETRRREARAKDRALGRMYRTAMKIKKSR